MSAQTLVLRVTDTGIVKRIHRSDCRMLGFSPGTIHSPYTGREQAARIADLDPRTPCKVCKPLEAR